MKNSLLLWLMITLCVAFSSCKKTEEVARPDNLISEDKMVTLLAEQYVWESTLDHVKNGLQQYAEEASQDEIDSLSLHRDTLLYAQVCRMVSQTYTPVSAFPTPLDAIHDLAYKFYGNWFKKNDISEQQYQQSLKYYLRSPDAAQGFVEKVRAQITQWREKSGVELIQAQENFPAVHRKSPQKPSLQ